MPYLPAFLRRSHTNHGDTDLPTSFSLAIGLQVQEFVLHTFRFLRPRLVVVFSEPLYESWNIGSEVLEEEYTYLDDEPR